MLALPTVNLHTKFKVSTFTYYKDTKDNAKCRNLVGFRGREKGVRIPNVVSNIAIQ